MPSKKLLNKMSKKGKKRGAADGGSGAAAGPASVDGLMEQGNIALSRIEPELALAFFQRALDMQPQNTEVMDALADVCMQLGDYERASELWTTSTRNAPTANPYKWLYLAQLQTDEAALDSYNRGIEFLTSQSSAASEEKIQVALNKQIAKAYCSIAELFLTDLCFAEDAEKRCEASISSALRVDPASLDALQAMGSLRLSQNRKADACSAMEGVYSRIKTIRDKLRSRTVIDDLTEAKDDEYTEDMEDLPSTDFLLTTAKLLVECSSAPLAKMSLELCEDLMNDDDENIEIWFLAGVAAMGCDPVETEAARYYFNTGMELMNEIRRQCTEQREPFPYDQEYALLEDHLNMLPEPVAGVVDSAGMEVEQEGQESAMEEDA